MVSPDCSNVGADHRLCLIELEPGRRGSIDMDLLAAGAYGVRVVIERVASTASPSVHGFRGRIDRRLSPPIAQRIAGAGVGGAVRLKTCVPATRADGQVALPMESGAAVIRVLRGIERS